MCIYIHTRTFRMRKHFVQTYKVHKHCRYIIYMIYIVCRSDNIQHTLYVSIYIYHICHNNAAQFLASFGDSELESSSLACAAWHPRIAAYGL